MKHCPLPHVPYVPAKFEVAMANGLGDAFTRKKHYLTLTKVTQNVAQYSRHHVTYAPEKFGKFKVPNKGPFVSTDGRQTDFGRKLIYPFF